MRWTAIPSDTRGLTGARRIGVRHRAQGSQCRRASAATPSSEDAVLQRRFAIPCVLLFILACAPGAHRAAPSGTVAHVVPAEAVVDTGRLAGAAYRVEVPRGWSGGLVVYAHGY